MLISRISMLDPCHKSPEDQGGRLISSFFHLVNLNFQSRAMWISISKKIHRQKLLNIVKVHDFVIRPPENVASVIFCSKLKQSQPN